MLSRRHVYVMCTVDKSMLWMMAGYEYSRISRSEFCRLKGQRQNIAFRWSLATTHVIRFQVVHNQDGHINGKGGGGEWG